MVLPQLRAGHPREVFRHVGDSLELAKAVNGTFLAEALMRAESTGGSAIGDGVAVVSARVPVTLTTQRLCAFVRLLKPVSFKGVEPHPCDLVFVMVSPEGSPQEHLRDLSAVIRALRDRDFSDRLRAETTQDRMISLFRARDIAQRAAA